jgi:hypothetical protein
MPEYSIDLIFSDEYVKYKIYEDLNSTSLGYTFHIKKFQSTIYDSLLADSDPTKQFGFSS